MRVSHYRGYIPLWFKILKVASGGSIPVLCSIAGVYYLIAQRFHIL